MPYLNMLCVVCCLSCELMCHVNHDDATYRMCEFYFILYNIFENMCTYSEIFLFFDPLTCMENICLDAIQIELTNFSTYHAKFQ
jgi:hypothetical protein